MSFRILKKANTVNFSQSTWESTNEKIENLEKKYNISFENSKHLFDFLLDFATNTELNSKEVQKVPDGFELISTKKLEEINNSFRLKNERMNELETLIEVERESADSHLENYNSVKELPEVLEKFYQSKNLKREDKTHVQMINSLINNPELSQDQKEESENQILLTLTDKNYPVQKKKILLELILQNRNAALNKKYSLNDLIEEMIFNDNVIFDLGGEFYTGIYTKKDIK